MKHKQTILTKFNYFSRESFSCDFSMLSVIVIHIFSLHTDMVLVLDAIFHGELASIGQEPRTGRKSRVVIVSF